MSQFRVARRDTCPQNKITRVCNQKLIEMHVESRYVSVGTSSFHISIIISSQIVLNLEVCKTYLHM
jgi:hypothetical protein